MPVGTVDYVGRHIVLAVHGLRTSPQIAPEILLAHEARYMAEDSDDSHVEEDAMSYGLECDIWSLGITMYEVSRDHNVAMSSLLMYLPAFMGSAALLRREYTRHVRANRITRCRSGMGDRGRV